MAALRDSDETLLFRLYEAMNATQFSEAMFELIRRHVPHQLLMLILRPGEFDLPVLLSDERYRAVTTDYLRRDHRSDIWMKRSPIHPGLRVVRHSDHTPRAMLRASVFYRRTLRRLESESGTSMVAWRGKNWLATLTIMRNEAQGDITDAEIAILEGWHHHFSSALKRLARWHEQGLAAESVENLLHALPMPVAVLDWDVRPIRYNALAQRVCERWNMEGGRIKAKRGKGLPLPGELIAAIREEQGKLPAGSPQAQGAERKSRRLLVLAAAKTPGLEARVEFVPARTLSLSRGTFVVSWHESAPNTGKPDTHDLLSRREEECARHAAAGMTNAEIAKHLGTSPITVRNQLSAVYQKWGIRHRQELVAIMMARQGL